MFEGGIMPDQKRKPRKMGMRIEGYYKDNLPKKSRKK